MKKGPFAAWASSRAGGRKARRRKTIPSQPPPYLAQLHASPSASWTPRSAKALAREGFVRNAIAYRAIRMIAEAAASVPWLLHEGTREMREHPLLDLLQRPNARQSGMELMDSWYSHLHLFGNAYLEAVNLMDDMAEIHLLRADRVRIISDNRGWPAFYEYSVGGRARRYPEQTPAGIRPILHMRLFHPTDDHYGMSPLEAAAYSVDIHNAAGRWAKALLDNSARPSGALVYKGPDGAPNMTDEQFKRLKSELEDNYAGAINAGRPLLLEGGLEWASMGHSPKDMEFIQTKHVAAREIALAFGVPPMLLGIPGDNTYSNFAEANRSFWRQTLLPLTRRTAQALTNWLAPRFGRAIRLSPDTDRIVALSSEREALWERVARADFLTINEKRLAVGYSPLEGGDMLESAKDDLS